MRILEKFVDLIILLAQLVDYGRSWSSSASIELFACRSRARSRAGVQGCPAEEKLARGGRRRASRSALEGQILCVTTASSVGTPPHTPPLHRSACAPFVYDAPWANTSHWNSISLSSACATSTRSRIAPAAPAFNGGS